MENNKLALSRTSAKKLGAEIYKEVEIKRREKFKETIVSKVEQMQDRLRYHYRMRDSGDSWIAHIEARLKAISDGEFTISETGTIHYNEGALNDAKPNGVCYGENI